MSRFRLHVTVAVFTAFSGIHPARADWQPDGNPVGVGPAPNNHVAVTPDGTGGMIVAWRKGLNCCATVCAQRLSADGEPLWGPSGVAVYVSNNGSSTRAVVSDGQGGAIVFWSDFRTGVQRLRAQRLDAAGGILWAAGGIALSTSVDVQVNPKAIADGAGGAIIAWQEYPSAAPDSTDLRAQRIGPDGTLSWSAASAPVCVGFGTQSAPDLESDQAGGALLTWTDARSGTSGADVYAQRLNLDGTPRWTAGGTLVCNAATDQLDPTVAPDGGGGALVAWEDSRSGPADVYAQRLGADGTPAWTANGVAVAAAANAQRNPVLAPDGGGAFVAWHDLRNSPATMFYAQRLDASGISLWGANGTVVSDSSVRGTVVSMVRDGLGGATLGWTSTTGADDIRAQKLNGGGGLEWPVGGVVICAAPGAQGAQKVVADGAGGALMVWEDRRAGGQSDSTEVYAQRVRASGAVGPAPPPAWPGNGAPVASAAGIQQNPAIAPSGVGGAILAWENFGGAAPESGVRTILGPGHAKIFSLGLDDTGLIATGWSEGGTEMSNQTSTQVEPQIAADDSGGAMVVWTDDRNGNWDLYAQRVTASGEIASGWSEAGVAVCTASGHQRAATVIQDGEGGAFVLWQDERGADADIYALRMTRTGTPASGWPANGLAVSTATGDQRSPVATTDGAGGVIVAWRDERSGNADVYAQRIAGAGGSAVWSSGGVAVCTASGDQDPTAIVPDGTSGAIVAWTDLRVDSSDVYAQRVVASGVMAWASNGIAVVAADGQQRQPNAVSDGVGGLIVAWEDSRSGGGGGFDLFAQRVTGQGEWADGWPANGAPLCVASGDQLVIQLVSDGQGGAIASWQDGRGAETDIYATQIMASGAIDPRWPPNGSVLCDASGDQVSPGIVSDGSGGAIIGWTDGRLPASDVYAMHIFGPSSTSPTAVSGRSSLPRLWMSAHPNPSAGMVSLAFELPVAGRARLDIVDVTGRRVRTLIAARDCPAGPTLVRWDRRESAGGRVRAGIYFARLRVEFPAEAGAQTVTRRLVLIQ